MRHRNKLLENEHIIFKHQNENIKKLYDTMVAYPAEEGVFGGMTSPVFKEYKPKAINSNASDPAAMYPVVEAEQDQLALYHRKSLHDYGPKHNLAY